MILGESWEKLGRSMATGSDITDPSFFPPCQFSYSIIYKTDRRNAACSRPAQIVGDKRGCNIHHKCITMHPKTAKWCPKWRHGMQ